MKRRGGVRLLPLLAATFPVACGAGGSGQELDDRPIETDRVTMAAHYRFDPTVIRIPAGTTVTWYNADDFTHTVHLDDAGSSAPIRRATPGDSFSITFRTPGEYSYTCSLHPHQMHGKVIVSRSTHDTDGRGSASTGRNAQTAPATEPGT